MGLDERKALMQRIAFATPKHPIPTTASKYDSINTMERSQKVEALKDNKLDPTQIKDPYDKLAHAFNLWTELGAKAKAAPNISFTEQRKIAENFYDGMLAPIYANDLKLAPMEKELWMKQAYEQALGYKIENAYGNDWLQSMRHGWNSGLAATARAAHSVTTMLGNGTDDAIALAKQFAETTVKNMQPQRNGWHDNLADLHNAVANVKHEHTDFGDAVLRGAVVQDENRQFWADAIPSRDGMLNKSTDFVAEQVAQAPVYAAMYLGAKGLGVGGGTSLTERLMSNPAGRKIVPYLLAGGEGLAYGAAVSKQNDPGEKYRDAIGFMTFHGLFDVGGMGLKKLSDMFPAGSKQLELLKRRQDELELRMDGNKTADPVEQYNMHKKETANNIAVVGIPGQLAIHADAVGHLAETEAMSRTERVAYEAKLLEEDPARWSPVLSASRYIRQLLPSGMRYSELLQYPHSEMATKVREGLNRLVFDSASEMNTLVKDMPEASQQQAKKQLKDPSAKHTLEFYVNKVKKDLAKDEGAAALLTSEHIQAAAEKMYGEDLQKAAQHAEKEAGASKVERANNIGQRVKPAMKIRSERTVSGKNVSVRYQIEPDYKVRLAEHQRAAKKAGMGLTEWFRNLSDEDFGKDLSDYFYPKALKKVEIFFENQHTREGMQNPNFLAFMHNYSDSMPKEFADELKSRFVDTAKVQKHIKGQNLTEPQLDYYAKAMHNHVDNFLGSGRWPNEANIFRSSNENMFKSTVYQRELLIEKGAQEIKNLKDAFSGNPKELKSALGIYGKLAGARLEEFDVASQKRNSQEVILSLDDQISDLITANKKYERWNY